MDRPRRNAGSHAEEALGDQFNRMAAHLRDSYATLEQGDRAHLRAGESAAQDLAALQKSSMRALDELLRPA